MLETESNVRSYCRRFTAEFTTARGTLISDIERRTYLDFVSGCGSLNYGHNHPVLVKALLEHIERDGLVMSLDLETDTKRRFLNTFKRRILKPRGLDYKVQFTGPTGANAVEAAIKLARKVTGRSNVIAFTNAFHGCSLGALALTGSRYHRSTSVTLLNQVTRFPYEGYMGAASDDGPRLIERMLEDPSSGCDAPAAIILETVQGEGGLNTASSGWLKRIAEIARHHGALLIVDDIQAGCGRTGTFFSFEGSKVVPDIVVLAKSISGFGLPMSLVLIKPTYDRWLPAEHNGTFRGNNYAFVTADASIEHYWATPAFGLELERKTHALSEMLESIAARHALRVKGRGLMQGLDLQDSEMASAIQRQCFNERLLIETCGPNDEILKLMPPLTVSDDELSEALCIIDRAITACRSPGGPRSTH